MRIVALADTHTFQAYLPPLPDGDVFIHAGDLCRGGRLSELQPAIEWIRSLPHPHKLLIAGNHDWCFLREKQAALELLGSEITYLEDSGVEISGVRFWGSPWQPEFHDWAFNLPRGSALAEKWSLIPPGTDVLITHGPPYRYGDWTYDRSREGCRDLLSAAQRIKPLLHLFGHIHEDGGCWQVEGVTFANVTAWECDRTASVFDLDIATRKLVPVFIPPPTKPVR